MEMLEIWWKISPRYKFFGYLIWPFDQSQLLLTILRKVTQITTASMQGTIFESSRYILVWIQIYFQWALHGGVVRASNWLSKGWWFEPQLSYLTIRSVEAPADNLEKSHTNHHSNYEGNNPWILQIYSSLESKIFPCLIVSRVRGGGMPVTWPRCWFSRRSVSASTDNPEKSHTNHHSIYAGNSFWILQRYSKLDSNMSLFCLFVSRLHGGVMPVAWQTYQYLQLQLLLTIQCREQFLNPPDIF